MYRCRDNGLAEHEEMAGIAWRWDRTQKSPSGNADAPTSGGISSPAAKKRQKTKLHQNETRKWRPAEVIRNGNDSRNNDNPNEGRQKRGLATSDFPPIPASGYK